MPHLVVLFVMSPLALIGRRQEEEEKNAEEDGEREQENLEGETDEDSEDDRDVIDNEQELEDVKSWASCSLSLRRIYVCHACDDTYDEMGVETFGSSFVIFRNSADALWERASLELGGSGYHRAVAWRGGARWGRGIKKEDQDLFDDSGLGFSDDGWPVSSST